jgi:putative tryptophan/tyrosine transport system substrate-binding protein
VERRTFVRLIGGAAATAGPPSARAQETKIPVIGFLNGFSLATWASPVGGFHKGLSETGYVEGRNVTIEYRWAEGQYDRLPALASELVRRPVAVLVATGGSAAAHAAKAATTTIPIVFGVGTNPFRSGLITSLSRPVGNATGVWFLTGDLESKRLGLLHELVPRGAVIAVLFNPRNLNTATESKQLQADAHTLGQPIHILHASSDPEIDTAFASLSKFHAAALLVGSDPFYLTRHDHIVALAARHAIPTIYHQREFVDVGGLMSYGTDLTDATRQVGLYTGRILRGAKPADLPVMQSTRFELVINLKTAKALGLTIPPAVLARADAVIE